MVAKDFQGNLVQFFRASKQTCCKLVTSWWFQPIWKNIRQIGKIFPKDPGENKKCLSCHHLGKFMEKVS